MSILAPWVAQKELAEGSLCALPLGKRKLKRRWGILFRKGQRLTLAQETFIGLCKAVADNFREGRQETTSAGSPDAIRRPVDRPPPA